MKCEIVSKTEKKIIPINVFHGDLRLHVRYIDLRITSVMFHGEISG